MKGNGSIMHGMATRRSMAAYRPVVIAILAFVFVRAVIEPCLACDFQEALEMPFHIASILDNGSTLVLSDGSTWDVDHDGALAAGQWKVGDEVYVTILDGLDITYITDLRYWDSVNAEKE